MTTVGFDPQATPLLRTLGEVGIVTHQDFRSPGGPKPRALLALLACRRGDPVAASELAEGLWGARAPANERASIQVLVSRLRSFLEPFGASVDRVGSSYSLELGSLVLDLDQFEIEANRSVALCNRDQFAMSLAAANRAFELWMSAPFADVVEPLVVQSELMRLDEMNVELVEAAAACELGLGQTAAGIARLSAHLRNYPGREPAAAALMTALYQAGRQREALECYAALREDLRRTAGLEPGPTLRQLELDIIQQNPRLDEPTAALLSVQNPAERGTRNSLDPVGIVVGRATEEAAISSAVSRRDHVLLLGGPGTGKSTLAGRIPGSVVGRCVQLTGTPPLWPWPHILEELHRVLVGARLDDSAVSRALSLLKEPQDDGVFAVSLSVVEALRSASGVVGAVVLEDIHWALPSARILLNFVTSELLDGPSLVVTSRGARVDHDWAGVVVELSALAESAVASLLQARVGMPVSSRVLDIVMRETGGVPLLVSRAASLVAGDEPFLLPERDMMLSDWLHEVADADRAVLEVASLVGETFAIDLVAAVLTTSDVVIGGDALASLDRCLHHQLVEGGQQRSLLSFRHALLRIALMESIPPGRRAKLHLEIANELMSRPGAETRSSEIAQHLAGASLVAPAKVVLEYSLRAANEARDAGAHDEAIQFLKAAVQAADHCELSIEDRLALERSAGEVLWLGGDNVGARAHFARAAALLADDDPRLVEVAADYAGFGLASVELDDQGFALLERALGASKATTASAAQLRCRTRQVIGGWDDMTIDAAANSLYEESQSVGDLRARTWSLGALLIASMTMSGATTRLDRSIEMIVAGEEIGSDSAIGLGLVHRADALAECGRFDELAPVLDRIQQLAVATARPAHRWYELHYGAALLIAQGHYERGEEQLGLALSVGQETHQASAFEAYSASLFVSRYARGRSGELLELVDQESAPTRMSELGLNAWHLGIGLCLLDDGQTGAARERLDVVLAGVGTVVRQRVRSIELAQLIDLSVGLGDREGASLGRDWLREHSGRCCCAAGMTIFGAADSYLGLAELLLGNKGEAQKLLADGAAQNRRWGLGSWEGHGWQKLGLLNAR